MTTKYTVTTSVRSTIDHGWFTVPFPGLVVSEYPGSAITIAHPQVDATWQISEEAGKTVATAPDGLTRYTAERERPGMWRKATNAAQALGRTTRTVELPGKIHTVALDTDAGFVFGDEYQGHSDGGEELPATTTPDLTMRVGPDLPGVAPSPVYALTSAGREFGLRKDPNKWIAWAQQSALSQGFIALVPDREQ